MTTLLEAQKQKLLYFVTEDWYFCSHRLALAKAAQQAGWAVSVLTRVKRHGDVIREAGINLLPLQIVRGGLNPFLEFRVLHQVRQVYRQFKPDLVHHVAMKPVLYGGLVAMTLPHLKVVNLMAGLGGIFSSRNWKAVLLRPLVKIFFRIMFRRVNTLTILQNQEDYDLLRFDLKIPEAQLRLIKGSGVNVEQFYPMPIENPVVNVALVSRLLWDKGIGEFVEAAKRLKQKGLPLNAFLVGSPDEENMGSITAEQLQAWHAEGYVKCLGRTDDVAQLWQTMDIAVLPSYYGEGIPKCLIEAAACGLPIVTTDMPGCNAIVVDGDNGFLVSPRSVEQLAEAIETLILNPSLRQTMGQAGRHKVEREFSDAVILTQTLAVYREMQCGI